METYCLVVSTPRAPLIGGTMTPEREREIAHEVNARAFRRACGREPVNATEVSAWIWEALV